MHVRDAQDEDRDAIRQVVAAAFGRTDEADLVDQLHRDGAGVVELVAEDEGAVIGHVLLSRMRAPFPALGLAPVAVIPARQGRGVGSALIREAIRRARLTDAVAIFVLGDETYYGRFGFDVAAAAGFACRFSGPHFAVLPLTPPLPVLTGEVAYASAFD